MHGVLGPNGAGKTTAVRILATLLKADEGTAIVAGHDVAREPARVREQIGLTGQYASVDELLTGRQNLELIGALLDLAKQASARRARRSCSPGSTSPTPPTAPPRPTPAACAAASTSPPASSAAPAIVFLDEPTTGLDPAKREDMWGVVRNLVADGATVLLTTQYLEEADALADEITVIDHGRVIAHDTPDGLKHIVGGQTLMVRPVDPTRLDEVEQIITADRAGARRPPGPRHRVRPGHRRRGARRGRLPPDRRRHRRHRALADAAEPRPGLLLPHRPPHGGRPRARGGARMIRLARHSTALAKRNLIGVYRNPEALLDVTLQPIIFILLFTYVFGGAISGGSQHDYLQFLLPGIIAQTIAFGGVAIGVNLNSDIEKGVFDRFQSLPIARVRAARRRRARRRRALRAADRRSRSASAT